MICTTKDFIQELNNVGLIGFDGKPILSSLFFNEDIDFYLWTKGDKPDLNVFVESSKNLVRLSSSKTVFVFDLNCNDLLKKVSELEVTLYQYLVDSQFFVKSHFSTTNIMNRKHRFSVEWLGKNQVIIGETFYIFFLLIKLIKQRLAK